MMSGNTEFDPMDDGTSRPNEKPLKRPGTCFQPMEVQERNSELDLPGGVCADDSFALFTLYYTPEIINSVVQYLCDS